MSSSFPSLTSSSKAFPLPSISEDTLYYAIHLPPDYEPSSTAVIITDHVLTLLPKEWMWNKDDWELKVAAESSSRAQRGIGSKLEGTMRVGDAVDDEWAVVWLLREVSKKWPEFVISIRDTDGEFLLIEAANELPNWVSPENAENRLWLMEGHLSLIPLVVRSSGTSVRHIPDDEDDERNSDSESYLNEEDALRAVKTGKYRTELKLENVVWDRISHYPEKLKEHLHRTKTYLPLPIARILSVSPSLIQKAVEAFYVRDPSQLRGAAKMTHFPPSPAGLTSVLMTRAAYAQLQGQVFHPPRSFGPEWTPSEDAGEKEERWRDLGVKISTGFEIMYKEGGKRTGGAGKVNVEGDKDYEKYIDNLKKAGWFNGEMEGSQLWKEREEKALEGWKNVKGSDTTSQRPSFAYICDQALKVSRAHDSVSANLEEDSDSWLDVDPTDLDDILMKASGQTSANREGKSGGEKQPQNGMEGENEGGKVLSELAAKVEAFVGGQGDLQGARFEDELSDDDMQSEDDEDVQEEDGDPWTKLSPADKAERMRNLVAPLEEGEWGRKKNTEQTPEIQDEDDDIVNIGSTAPTKVPTAPSSTEQPIVTIPRESKMRPPVFTKQEYDGVIAESESEDDEGDEELPISGSIGRKISQMKWSDGEPRIQPLDDSPSNTPGGESDDDMNGDEDDRLDEQRNKSVKWDDKEIDRAMRKKVERDQRNLNGDEDDKPMVINANGDEVSSEHGDEEEGEEDDVNMDNEQEEFLKFAREALGVNEDQWNSIIQDREGRGAFVPKSSSINQSTAKASSQPNQAPSEDQTAPAVVNDKLDSFDKVMEAMEAELSKIKPSNSSKSKSTSSKSSIPPIPPMPKLDSKDPLPPLPTEADLEAMSDDDLLAMDRELRSAFKSAGIEEDEEDDYEIGDLDEEKQREYKMMKDLLLGYTAQGGQSGPIGNLLGRLSKQ